MRIAFYAPLKSPLHPIPSGDRLIARAFFAALESGGHEVTLAARLRSWDGSGDAVRQQRIADIGRAISRRLVSRWRSDPNEAPKLWFSYHVYHKAPDWIGPAVSSALGIPYIVAEASVALKQRDGRWKAGHLAATTAIRDADEVICINPTDVAGVAGLRSAANPVVRLAPFFDVDAFVTRTVHLPLLGTLPQNSPRLITVAMMRYDNKLDSYRALASSLALIEHRRWHLVIVGDGRARPEVEAAFARFEPARVHFAGALPRESIAALLQSSHVFVWPAVDEVIGMSLIEAQACGLPVVAGRGAGVASIVDEGRSGLLVPADDRAAFGTAVERLLADEGTRRALSSHARAFAKANHDLLAAARALDLIVAHAVRRRDRADPR